MHEFNSPTKVQRNLNHFTIPKQPQVQKRYKEFQEIGHIRGATIGRKPTEMCPTKSSFKRAIWRYPLQ